MQFMPLVSWCIVEVGFEPVRFRMGVHPLTHYTIVPFIQDMCTIAVKNKNEGSLTSTRFLDYTLPWGCALGQIVSKLGAKF